MNYIITLWIILIFIILYILLIQYRDKILIKKILKNNRNVHSDLRKILRIVVNYLEKEEIPYFLIGGTLLGNIRHNHQFIPHDDDIDLGIIKNRETIQKMDTFISRISREGIRIESTFFGYKCYLENGSKTALDLFYYEKGENEVYHFDNLTTRMLWSKEYFKDDELFPLKRDLFENIPINIPNKSIDYLFRSYGKDCLDKYRITHVHTLNFWDNLVCKITKYSPINLFKNIQK